MDFTHIKLGLAFAMIAILFGGIMGLGFGCCEEVFKDTFKEHSRRVLGEKYNGSQNKADKVSAKSWVYMKRAHLHSQTMGVISIALSLIAAGLSFPRFLQISISLMSGLGAIGYGLFWLLASFFAPSMGSTGAAKEIVGFLAQISTGSFLIATLGLFLMLGFKVFIQKSSSLLK